MLWVGWLFWSLHNTRGSRNQNNVMFSTLSKEINGYPSGILGSAKGLWSDHPTQQVCTDQAGHDQRTNLVPNMW